MSAKKRIDKKAIRNKQIKDGFFDGRFAPKVHKSKKNYKRKPKYKPRYYEEE